MRRSVTILALVALAAVAVTSERQLQGVPRGDPLERQLLYLPSAEFLRLVSLGNHQLMADLMYLWAIQYYSLYDPHEQFLYVERMFDLITDLDPLYFDAYRMGALIMQIQTGGDQRRIQDAVERLFDKGLANRPDDWELAETAAWDMIIRYRDMDAALRYLEEAVRRPGVSHRTIRVLGRLKDRTHDWSMVDSVLFWREAVATAEDEFAERKARRHLYEASYRLNRSLLEPLLAEFRRATGRCPADWQQLIDAGLLGDVPRDELGTPYLISEQDCSVQAAQRIRGL